MRVTHSVLQVLRAFLEAPGDDIYGSELIRLTGRSSGTVYPVLVRLEEAGWVKSQWEDEDASDLGRPQRRLYRLTAKGQAAAREEFQRTFGVMVPAFARPKAS